MHIIMRTVPDSITEYPAIRLGGSAPGEILIAYAKIPEMRIERNTGHRTLRLGTGYLVDHIGNSLAKLIQPKPLHVHRQSQSGNVPVGSPGDIVSQFVLAMGRARLM